MTIHSDCQSYDLISVQAYLIHFFIPYRRGDALYMWEQVLHKLAVKPVFLIRVLFRYPERRTKPQRKENPLHSFLPSTLLYPGAMKEVLFVTCTKQFS